MTRWGHKRGKRRQEGKRERRGILKTEEWYEFYIVKNLFSQQSTEKKQEGEEGGGRRGRTIDLKKFKRKTNPVR